jgi:hypothetical protein
MSFDADVNRFALKLEGALPVLVPAVATAVLDSIRFGSPLTGAPGQPVQTSNLLKSWQLTFPDAMTGRITTNVIYAPLIEEGVSRFGRPLTLRSAVGGFHSVALTRAGFQRLANHEVERLKLSSGGAS